MKIYDSRTNVSYDITEHDLKGFLFRNELEAIAEASSPKIAFNCGVLAGCCPKIISTLYSLEFQRSNHDNIYLKRVLEVLSEVFDIDVTEDKFKSLIEDCVDVYLKQEHIFLIEIKESK